MSFSWSQVTLGKKFWAGSLTVAESQTRPRPYTVFEQSVRESALMAAITILGVNMHLSLIPLEEGPISSLGTRCRT
jgi:hypothetical protein